MKAYRLLALTALATSTAAFGGLVACGSSSSPSEGDDSSETDASVSDARGDAVIVAPPGSGDAAAGDGASDSAVDAGPPAPVCDPTEKADDTQIFVSPGGMPTGTCFVGTPCNSIQAGIAQAVADGKTTVYVEQGTYTEQLTLSPGVTVRGGWTALGGWAPICDSTRFTSTIVQPPAGADRAVIAKDLGGTATLQSLYIQNKTTAQSGQSLYGVFATGATTNLVLTDVSVVVAAGGRGVDGAAGAAGGVGFDTSTCTTSATPATASPATPAPSAGAEVTYTASGATVTTASTGTVGGPGQSGTVTGTGPCVTTDECSDSLPGEPCTVDGTDTNCGLAYAGICGGPGGVGGGGTGGGSSIALFAFDAQVTVNRGQLLSGAGGDGGNGGAAGAAGQATPPHQTSPASCKGCGKKAGGTCGCSSLVPGGDKPGGPGVPGTAGAAGVAGAGGAGGDSFSLYQNANNVNVTNSTQTTLLPGAAGAGGAGSPAGTAAAQASPAGLPGRSGTHNG
jgi:hypothetical protein